MLLSRKTASLLVLSYSIICVHAQVTSSYKYCKKYFGSVSAELELPDTIPEYNYNGTIRCPSSMTIPRVSGATLEICPPDSLDTGKGEALKARLSMSQSGILDLPIDGLDFTVTLITNGSVSGPFENGGTPALLAADAARSAIRSWPVWTINGTQASLVESPQANDDQTSVFFGCQNIKNRYAYCGGYEDLHQHGCWSSQTFLWNMQTPLNYTIRFATDEASVEIWTESEYVFYDGTKTGGMTKAYLRFGGDPSVPSVVDYDFWRNAESVYEVEQRNFNNIDLKPDESGLPLFVNRSHEHEWYDSTNGTYKEENGAVPGSINRNLGEVVLLSFLFCFIAMMDLF